jgi:glycosyltransferase involved in cell wall biosynthesis
MKKPETVIFSLLDTPAFGGAEQYMFSHLQFLHQKGYHIVLATNNQKVKEIILGRLTKKQKETFHVIPLPYRLDAIGNIRGLIKFFIALPKAYMWCNQTLEELNKRYKKVICLWPGFSDRLAFSNIAHSQKCPLIWIEIGPLEPTFKHNFHFPQFLYKLAEKYPNHIVTTSLFTKKSILRNTHFKNTDITLVYPGTKLFSNKEILNYREEGKKWQKKEKLEKKIVIGLVARLAAENEVDMVIRAISFYKQKNETTNIVLTIIGDGPVKKDLEMLVEKLEIKDTVRFTGFVSEEEKLVMLSACTFFIFPRAWDLDGFGMTTIEAMSLGIPVLTTDFGPQIEIVTDGKEGFRYKPHNSKDLAKKIEKMLSLKTSQRQKMSKNSLERVTLFSDNKSHEIMFDVLSRFNT